MASSTETARCLRATPIVSSWLEISFARAVAARSTLNKYSLSPLVSPRFGLPWLAGVGNEVTSKDFLLSWALQGPWLKFQSGGPWQGRRFVCGPPTSRYDPAQHIRQLFSQHRLPQLLDGHSLNPCDLPLAHTEIGGKRLMAHRVLVAIQGKATLDHAPFAQVEAT